MTNCWPPTPQLATAAATRTSRLTAVHTVFHAEHNRLAAEIPDAHRLGDLRPDAG